MSTSSVFNSNTPGGSYRILLIEDDPEDALLFRHAVPEECELLVIGNGDDGLNAIAEGKPDLIFLDLMLPGMSGEEVCKKVRLNSDPKISGIPIIMVSGKTSEADAVIGRVIGANSYLAKPYVADMVQEEIHKYLPRNKWPKRKTNKILVIEDDPEDWALIKTMLMHDKKQSYNLVHMDQLQKGLDYLSRVKPELIITDLCLPDSQGIETFRKIMQTAPRTPIIILSGTEDELTAEEAVHLGAQDYIMKSELTPKNLSRSVRYGIERQSLIEANQRMALNDDLTGLHNRRAFMFLVEQQLKACRRQNRPLLMIYVDMDSLKRINDTLGHEVGDQAIVQMAHVLKSTFRESDIVARLGGDEFAVVEVDFNSANVDAIEKRLAGKIKQWNLDHPASSYKLEASFGIRIFDFQENLGLSEFIRRTDAEMYHQKTLKKKRLADTPKPDDASPPFAG